jgi:hypothetical protein
VARHTAAAPFLFFAVFLYYLLFVYCLDSNSLMMSVQVDVVAIASDIWKDLVEAFLVEPPLNVKPFYDEVIKVEDPTNNKVLVDFKRLSDLSVAEFNGIIM